MLNQNSYYTIEQYIGVEHIQYTVLPLVDTVKHVFRDLKPKLITLIYAIFVAQ